MTVKTPHGEFDVRDLTFRDRRKLHSLEIRSVSDGEVDLNKFYEVLEWVMDFAFKNPEDTFAKLDDNQIDEVLLAVYNEYKEPSKKK